MNATEITLIIIGIIIIIISCILVDKTKKAELQPTVKSMIPENILTEEDEKQLRNKIDELLSEISEEVIVKADDTLSKISNEKIIAVNEFSDQILEKIKRNHEEVVFLYNMLNDKEKELKSVVKEIDSSKKKLQEIMETKAKSAGAVPTKENKVPTAPKPVTQAARIEKTVNTAADAKPAQERNAPAGLEGNQNTEILSLYSKGKSIVEISKLLELGQGEVKLVIDLFKGKK